MSETMNVIMTKKGNAGAFRQVYEEHGERIFRIAFRHTSSRPDAEDIMQNTFIKAFKKITTFQSNSNDSFSSWLNTICINCILDHFRKERRKHRHDQVSLSDLIPGIQSENLLPEDKMERKELDHHIQIAMSALPPRQRLIFEMRYNQHMILKDIAQTLRCSQSNVKTQISRVLKKLRRTLEPIWRKT